MLNRIGCKYFGRENSKLKNRVVKAKVFILYGENVIMRHFELFSNIVC